MDVQNIEKLNQLISRSDMTGNEKVEWLINFTENYQTLQLIQPDVIKSVCLNCGKPIEEHTQYTRMCQDKFSHYEQTVL